MKAAAKAIAIGLTAALISTMPMTVFAEEAAHTADFSFSDVSGIVFYFESGVGGWDTHLMIEPDGSFSGNYHDSDMGDTGEGYPNGTLYYCDFTGSFSGLEKIDDYTYSFGLADLEYARTPEDMEIIDGIRYVYSQAYGLEEAETFYMYLPGKPLAQLPEEYRSWVGYYDLTQTADTELPFYGLYNENAQDGFFGHPAEGGDISQRVNAAKEKSSVLETELEDENLSQQELNQKSYELYMVWDDVLNEIWADLGDTLDAETMDALTQEELAWIRDKEADVQAQGSEFEGGSLQPYIENMTAYRWTRDRVYELEERFG